MDNTPIKKTRKRTPYTTEFKTGVVLKILSKQMSVSEAKETYGVKSKLLVKRWVKQYATPELQAQAQGPQMIDLKLTDVPLNERIDELLKKLVMTRLDKLIAEQPANTRAL